MAYCRKCGAQIDDYAAVCPECGTPQNGGQNNTPPVVDNGGFLWGLLGCCIPIVGLILFLVWKDTCLLYTSRCVYETDNILCTKNGGSRIYTSCSRIFHRSLSCSFLLSTP